MIADTLQKQILEAMKAGDRLRVETLKLLSSAFHYEEIKKRDLTSADNKSGTLSDEEELKIVRSQIKKRKDVIEILRQAQDDKSGTSGDIGEKIEKEEAEMRILQEFLPEEMGDEELEKLVDGVIEKTGAKEMKDMGRVIGMVMGKAEGKVDGGRVAGMVRSRLTK